MDNQMFCFQCEQTAGCAGCKGADGVCGKKADTAQLQDRLTGALIGLARATEGNEYLINSGTDWTYQLSVDGFGCKIPIWRSSSSRSEGYSYYHFISSFESRMIFGAGFPSYRYKYYRYIR